MSCERIFLGALLGQYDRGQSLEQISSWSVIGGSLNDFILDDPLQGVLDGQNLSNPNYLAGGTGQTTFSVQTTYTHSSTNALKMEMEANGEFRISYNYGQSDDVYQRLYTDKATHRIMSFAWAATDTETYSGQSYIVFSGQAELPIGYNTSPDRYMFDFSINSGDAVNLTLVGTGDHAAAANVYLDSVTTAIDVMQLFPTMALQSYESNNIDRQYTLSGAHIKYNYHHRKRWMLSLQHLTTEEKNIINYWWRNRFNLMFTLDTSDYNELYVTQIKNTQMPIQERHFPYHDHWTGLLELQEVTRELVF